MSYKEVREPGSNKLLFRFDAERDTIEIQRRGIKTVVDLREIKEEEPNSARRPAAAAKN